MPKNIATTLDEDEVELDPDDLKENQDKNNP